MEKVEIGAVLMSLFIFVAIISFFIVKFKFFIDLLSKIFIKNKKNELILYRQYLVTDGYSEKTKFRKVIKSRLLKRARKHTKHLEYIDIDSYMNGYYYPFHDLDNKEDLRKFKKLYAGTPYVLLKSSSKDDSNNYWGIVDIPTKKIKKVFEDVNWEYCNDPKYVNYSKGNKRLLIRGLYNGFSRKPTLYYINKKLSKNFQLFIDKLLLYYNEEGFEISVIKYQNEEMIVKFNRKRKLKLLNKSNE